LKRNKQKTRKRAAAKSGKRKPPWRKKVRSVTSGRSSVFCPIEKVSSPRSSFRIARTRP